jgi:hypothetical protein
MTNQNLIIGNRYHVANVTVTTTPTTIDALLGTAAAKGYSNLVDKIQGRDILQITLSPAAAILVQDVYNNITLQISTSKTFPVLNPLSSIMLSCASATVVCSVEWISQDPSRT